MAGSSRSVVDMAPPMAVAPGNTSAIPLSEENLRIHDAACSESDGYHQINLIREERARKFEQQMFQRLSRDSDEPVDSRLGECEQHSLDALKLYPGSFASAESPMGRFLAMSPTQDTHPWMARRAMEDNGIECGDLEAMDLRRLVSEFVDMDGTMMDGSKEARAGSPQPSSEALSMSRFKEMKSSRKEGARRRKRIGMRRKSVVDQIRKSQK